jgi:carbon-monoxide dehydrogenase large subunit
MGQGIETALADVAVAELGLASRAEVTVRWGDTSSCPYTGYGTGGSRAGALGGASLRQAATELRGKILTIAGELLEADPDDLVLENSRIAVRGNPSAGCSLADVGFAAYRRVERLDKDTLPTLEGRAVFDPPAQAYSYGCAAALVQVERETGQTRVLDYVMSHDCGTVINKMIVEGQLKGGSMQAIAGALYEELIYDDNGQILTTTLMDYAFPTAMEIPSFGLAHMETPSPVIPGGMKGVGEAGVIPGGAAIASAVDDALGRDQVFVTSLPITAEKVFWMANPSLQSQR